jgi:hypothetical protein
MPFLALTEILGGAQQLYTFYTNACTTIFYYSKCKDTLSMFA